MLSEPAQAYGAWVVAEAGAATGAGTVDAPRVGFPLDRASLIDGRKRRGHNDGTQGNLVRGHWARKDRLLL